MYKALLAALITLSMSSAALAADAGESRGVSDGGFSGNTGSGGAGQPSSGDGPSWGLSIVNTLSRWGDAIYGDYDPRKDKSTPSGSGFKGTNKYGGQGYQDCAGCN